MADASPAKWHLAHTSWFFETVILQTQLDGYSPFNEQYAYLFNSYYNSLGERHARPQRGLLTRPGLQDVLAYRDAVDKAMLQALPDASTEFMRLCEIGLNHEQQHQELLLTDIKHAFSCNPLLPAYQPSSATATSAPEVEQWHRFDAGVYDIGHAQDGFCYDNETPRHKQYLQDFEICQQLVSNQQYLEFIQAGGYQQAEYWLSDGWDWIQRQQIKQPLYWHLDSLSEFTAYGLQAIKPQAPVCHLSFYEADAYARFRGLRLPSEAEWEVACQALAKDQRTTNESWHPTQSGWLNQVWQWTSSPYQPYPGYQLPQGPLGEYNAKFMCNQMVLRGGSVFTPSGHTRPSYRNFFYPQSRWQMTGLRLAKNVKQ